MEECNHEYVYLRQDQNKDLFYCRRCLQYQHAKPPRLPAPPQPPSINVYVDGGKQVRPVSDKAIHGPEADK